MTFNATLKTLVISTDPWTSSWSYDPDFNVLFRHFSRAANRAAAFRSSTWPQELVAVLRSSTFIKNISSLLFIHVF